MNKPLILIGFMGAGKTTVGTRLAKRLKVPFIDTDQYIESEQGRTISRIFAEDGEAYFRSLETGLLKQLKAAAAPAVISCGGGLPLREENRRLLKELGTVVYLHVQPETVIRRLKGDTTRPLLQGADASEKVYRLMEAREPQYLQAAEHVLETDALSADQIADQVLQL